MSSISSDLNSTTDEFDYDQLEEPTNPANSKDLATFATRVLQENGGTLRKDLFCNRICQVFGKGPMRAFLKECTVHGIIVDRVDVSLYTGAAASRKSEALDEAGAYSVDLISRHGGKMNKGFFCNNFTQKYSRELLQSFLAYSFEYGISSDNHNIMINNYTHESPIFASSAEPEDPIPIEVSERAIQFAEHMLRENKGRVRRDLFCNKISAEFGRDVMRKLMQSVFPGAGFLVQQLHIELASMRSAEATEQWALYIFPGNSAEVIPFIRKWQNENLSKIVERLQLAIHLQGVAFSDELVQKLREMLTLAFIRGGLTVDQARELFPVTAMLATSHQGLEFVGDSVLQFAVTEKMTRRQDWGLRTEGSMTELRTRLVCGDSCAAYSIALDLPQFLICNIPITLTTSIANDLTEAIIGAIYISLGADGFRVAHSLIFKQFIPAALEKHLIASHPDIEELLQIN